MHKYNAYHASFITIKPLLFIFIFFYLLDASAQIEVERGDIVIFNGPFQIENISIALYDCKSNVANCKDSILLVKTPVITPGKHYVFAMKSFKTLFKNSKIAVKVYSPTLNKWSDFFIVTTSYNPQEDPFYQFVCWTRHELPPYFFCTSGEDDQLQLSN